MKSLRVKTGLIFSLIACGILVILMRSDKPAFPNPMQDHFAEPIMALEFVRTRNDLDTILNYQTHTGTASTAARINFLRKVLQWDFPFMVSYGVLLFLLVHFNFFPGLIRNLLFTLVVIIVFSDVLENIFSLKLLDAYVTGMDLDAEIAWQYRFVLMKWILLFMVVFVLVRRSFTRLKLVGRIIGWVYGIMVIAFLIKPSYIVNNKINMAELCGNVTFLLIIILSILVLTSKHQNKLSSTVNAGP